MVLEKTGEGMNNAWNAAGALCVALGTIGIVIPLLPTTPFLLLAAGCFAKGSPRMYRWLMSNRLFGSHLESYREGKGLTTKAKIVSITGVVLGLTLSIIFTGFDLLISTVLVAVGAAVTIHILTIPNSDQRANRE
jgi:uncharacterized membrane protein YbaN (DUF454 family)